MDQLGVGPGGRDDDDRVGAAHRVFHRWGVDRLQLLREGGGAWRVGVVYPELVDARGFVEDLRVERAEAAHTKDGDLHSNATLDCGTLWRR